MRKFLLFSSFFLSNFAILVISLLFLALYTSKQSSAVQPSSPQSQSAFHEIYRSFNALPGTGVALSAQIVAADARDALIDNFFRRYNSPMTGLGVDIVTAADKYKLPFGLLPAIAQCEGNVGKVMPFDSYNPYGFGIYGDKVTRFSSWQEGIEIVSKTLRSDYYDLGLDTPEKIMGKYTPPSKGSWAFCVSKFMEELK